MNYFNILLVNKTNKKNTVLELWGDRIDVRDNIARHNAVPLSHEVGDAITHVKPKNKPVVCLETYHFHGLDKAQYMVKEDGIIPINLPTWKENPRATEYLQENIQSYRVFTNLPKESTLFLKTNSTTSELSKVISKNDSPKDDGF